MVTKLSPEKKESLRDLADKTSRRYYKIYLIERSVIRSLVTALPGVEFGTLDYRTLERDKIKVLAENGGTIKRP